MSLLAAALGSLLLTGGFIQLAKSLGWGKSVRRDGPRGHLVKEGTPTMGGVGFLLAAAAVTLLADRSLDTLALLTLTAAAGALGLYDDVLSLRRKAALAHGTPNDAGNEGGVDASTGLLARYRLLGQAGVALAFGFYASGTGHALLGPAWLDAAAFALVVVATINAVNFSDGLDGLAAGMLAIMLLLFVGQPFAAALIGALLGFLYYNGHPARVFMGGVGSEALGAALAGLAILSGLTWYLPLLALVPVLEVLSVIVQVSYFRATGGRRLLKMSPLHHHFEESGWSEVQVVVRFWLFTAVCTALVWWLTGGA